MVVAISAIAALLIGIVIGAVLGAGNAYVFICKEMPDAAKLVNRWLDGHRR